MFLKLIHFDLEKLQDKLSRKFIVKKGVSKHLSSDCFELDFTGKLMGLYISDRKQDCAWALSKLDMFDNDDVYAMISLNKNLLKNLKELAFYGGYITLTNFKEIFNFLPNLEKIDITYTNIEQSTIKEIRKEFPKLKITYNEAVCRETPARNFVRNFDIDRIL